MKNISFEKPTLFKNIRKQVSFHVVKFCYLFPQKIDTWDSGYKRSTYYCWLWFRIIFHYKVLSHNYKEISTNPFYKENTSN